MKITDISPYDTWPEPVYHRYLEYLGPNEENKSGHSDKFWEVAIFRHDGRWKVIRRWGRYGKKGQIKAEIRHSRFSAKKHVRELKSKKRDKGYTKEIDVITRMGSLLDEEEAA